MTEDDIRGHVLALVGALSDDDKATATEVGVALLTQVLVDLNRIADALEYMATKTS
jgi:hypothetical protein